MSGAFAAPQQPMTDSVSLSRPRSPRSTRAPRRSRAAAADSAAPARTTTRPAGGEAGRDARTLDLFGMPVDEAHTAAGPAAVTHEADEGPAVAIDDGRQGKLTGFEPPAPVAAAEPDKAPEVDLTMGADAPSSGASTAGASADAPGRDEAARGEVVAEAVLPVDAASSPAVAPPPAPARSTSRRTTPRRADPANAPEGAAAVAAPKRRASRPAAEPTVAHAEPAVGLAPAAAPAAAAAPVASAAPAPAPAAALAATASSAPADTPVPSAATILVAPAASAASSAATDEAPAPQPPAVDLDAHLRPLADRIRALQIETVELRRAAGAEMRRVNRLLLALAVIVVVGVGALVAQTMTVSGLKHETVALQQRIDRLAAAQETQQANLITLAQRQDEQGAQVERLTNRLSVAARPAPKPARHPRSR